jgi:putative membrane protein
MRKEKEMTPKRVLFLVIGLLFAIFVFQNAQVVEVRFLFWSAHASRALVLLGTMILGLLAGWLTAWMRQKEHELEKKQNS